MHTNKGNEQDRPGTGDHPSPVGDFVAAHPNPGADSVDVGYETTDVNTGGIVVFLGGLFAFVIIFFVFCYLMGKAINHEYIAEDGPNNKWHQGQSLYAVDNIKNNPADRGEKAKGQNLESNAALEQQQYARVTQNFPAPRLDIDDGNQATADLHAREDLLLDYYSSVPGQPLRIPIDRAMQLIAQRGLPVQAMPSEQLMAGDKVPTITAPLTSGFARTGYELDTIQAREQRLEYGEAKSQTQAELKPLR
jgi:hypothetical protein